MWQVQFVEHSKPNSSLFLNRGPNLLPACVPNKTIGIPANLAKAIRGMLARILARILARHGFDVLQAGDGYEALTALDGDAADIDPLRVDYNMPERMASSCSPRLLPCGNED
jgi:hypothetical protein